MTHSAPSTGLSSLDEVLQGLLPGDNVVWQVESVDDYRGFVLPYCTRAASAGHELVYFRFAKHPPILSPGEATATVELDPDAGFETFIAGIHATLGRGGPQTRYVFDCLSELAADWFSDQMLGNFFMLTCPFVLRIRALAYFGLIRNSHSGRALIPISDTTQIMLDVFRFRGDLFVRPLKVEHRHSPTMFTLHTFDAGRFHPVTDSHAIAEVMTNTPRVRIGSAGPDLDVWSRTVTLAEDALERQRKGAAPPAGLDELFSNLLRMMFSRDERLLALARRHLALADLVAIAHRMVGTGLIGGKSAGMLLARAILRGADPAWGDILEPHDSFFIGSNVFYAFLVRNGLWAARARQKDPVAMLDGAEEARAGVLAGTFPGYIAVAIRDMLDYYGQSPIIVRSSSLLEDNFGNAFSGKYDSVFCANQGSADERMAEFLAAVRAIYASTMSERALRYRAQRGILDRDEQMAILVQRVSGSLHGGMFYPEAAGVGYSFNPYVWHPDIDPKAGMLRIVFGMGTRAVDRTDDDYTRIVALNAPQRRPEAGGDEARRRAQRRVDYLNLATRSFDSADFPEVAAASPGLELRRVASRDPELDRIARERPGTPVFPFVLTFDGLFADTPFVAHMRWMLATIEEAYGVPVDIEFTANFAGDGGLRVNLVQCRPMPAAGRGTAGDAPPDVDSSRIILRTSGPVIGTSRTLPIGRVILVRAAPYDRLAIQQRHAIARLIGRLTRLKPEGGGILLIGPGRWGTTTPNLGVPVVFAEIAPVGALCEVVAMREGLVPDVSLGTHFFNDLVEAGMLYLACFPAAQGTLLRTELLEAAPNRLAELLPPDAAKAEVVVVADAHDLGGITVHADAVAQRALCWAG